MGTPVKISDLTAGSTPTGAEAFPAVQSSSTVKLTLTQVKNWIWSLFTTKGDIVVATASATPARLGVGSDGQALKASSGETTGLIWAADWQVSYNHVLTGPTAARTYTFPDADLTIPAVTAKGDLLAASAAAVLARLAVGANGTHLFADSTQTTGLAWSALVYKAVRFTRDLTTASGTQAVTGAGFTPKAVLVLATVAAGSLGWSIGFADGSNNYCLYQLSSAVAGAVGPSDTECLHLEIATGSGQNSTAVLTSFDADGATFTFTKNGAPGATNATFYVLFLR